MKNVVRAFVFNQDGQVLLARHNEGEPLVLPGGHTEAGESLHEALTRELDEEFGLVARYFDIDFNEVLHHNGKKLIQHPLPIACYTLNYTRDGKDKSRTEYVFLMETDAEVKNLQNEEIFEYGWYDVDDVLGMKPNLEVWDFIIEMLEKITENDDED